MLIPVRDLDPALLRAFVAIADAGSFVRAAERLNRTQSALSMQVKRLEDLFDAVLFDRALRPPRLTAVGEKLLPYAREIISLNDSAIEDIRSDEIAGSVRLGVMEDLAVTHLAPIIRQVRSDLPLVRVDVETGLTTSFIGDLGRAFDIVVAMTETDHREGELLFRGRTCWVAAPEFEADRSTELPLALSGRDCLFRRWAVSALDRGNWRWHIGMKSTSVSALASFAAEGSSLTVMKDIAIPSNLIDVGERLGLPPLPNYELRLMQAPSAHRGAGKALADILAREIPNALNPSSLDRQAGTVIAEH